MIALQSLKYKIFEWCLDTLVDKLSNNFRTISQDGNIPYDMIVDGMRLSKIEIRIPADAIIHIDINYTWLGCKIILNDSMCGFIEFEYEKAIKNGVVINSLNRQIWYLGPFGNLDIPMKFYI